MALGTFDFLNLELIQFKMVLSVVVFTVCVFQTAGSHV
jgi:hypothetical protein